ncbi:MAG: hypothetical protein NT162_00665 [Candidatus Woesebacteria bacterium]|nr:hypothetical protein [Candidatus Woesebacteria bacterium]
MKIFFLKIHKISAIPVTATAISCFRFSFAFTSVVPEADAPKVEGSNAFDKIISEKFTGIGVLAGMGVGVGEGVGVGVLVDDELLVEAEVEVEVGVGVGVENISDAFSLL